MLISAGDIRDSVGFCLAFYLCRAYVLRLIDVLFAHAVRSLKLGRR